MIRSTTRALAILFLSSGAISSALAAPTSLPTHSTSSVAPTSNAPPVESKLCPRMKSLSGTGGPATPKATPHQRRPVGHGNSLTRRADNDNFVTAQNSEHSHSESPDTRCGSVMVTLKDRAESSDSGTQSLPAADCPDEPEDARTLKRIKEHAQEALDRGWSDQVLRGGVMASLDDLIKRRDTSETVRDDARRELAWLKRKVYERNVEKYEEDLRRWQNQTWDEKMESIAEVLKHS
ncbi:hypothetical protein F5880DRAFT_1511308 [Lentinula raphanica]|nr:hypothetical protein F5880DRAFT_1511308 [Lentinula raphanica]